MTRSDEPLFEPRIADWLEDDPNTAPDQALDVVLAAFPSIKQRRAWRVPWRVPGMTTPLRLGLTAAAVGAVAIGSLLFVNRGPSGPGGPGGPTPSATPAPTASSSPSASTSLLDPEHVDDVHIQPIRLQHRPPRRLERTSRHSRLDVPDADVDAG